MVGITNAQKTDIERSNDPHTMLLLTDTAIDRSMYNRGLDVLSADQAGALSVGTSTSFVGLRDGRKYMHFPGNANIRLCDKNLVPANHDWTLEVWIYPAQALGNACIFWQPVTNDSSYGLLWGYSEGARWLYLSNNGSSWNILPSSSCSNNNNYNVWKHMALVHKDAQLLCFTNGTLVATYNITNSWTFNGWAHIGRYAPAGYQFPGYMQDFRISDIARYTANFTPPQRLL